jgi:hypothetical protein
LVKSLKVRIDLAKHESWIGQVDADAKGNFILDVHLKPSKH